MKKNKKKKLGFTLAEILITLSIIGVVAALTIPTLIQRTGNEEYVSRLMKAYSTFSQATEMAVTENGSVKSWLTDVDAMYSIYKKYIRNARSCGTGAGCFSQWNEYKELNGNKIGYGDWNTSSYARKIILSDGTQAAFQFWSNSCNRTESGSTNQCGAILVDVNGEKGPNIFGRDVFKFSLKEDGLYPMGCDSEPEYACSFTGGSHGCACKVIQEGAMNY